MKDYEKVMEGLRICAETTGCTGCPYKGEKNGCSAMKRKARELLKEMKAQLEQSKTAGAECAVMPDYEAENRRLNDELSRVNAEYERTECELHRAEIELIHLRAVKATAEAFLGVKIDGQM